VYCGVYLHDRTDFILQLPTLSVEIEAVSSKVTMVSTDKECADAQSTTPYVNAVTVLK
jgi:hypothetical protein